jgi:hypothetical protein
VPTLSLARPKFAVQDDVLANETLALAVVTFTTALMTRAINKVCPRRRTVPPPPRAGRHSPPEQHIYSSLEHLCNLLAAKNELVSNATLECIAAVVAPARHEQSVAAATAVSDWRPLQDPA